MERPDKVKCCEIKKDRKKNVLFLICPDRPPPARNSGGIKVIVVVTDGSGRSSLFV